MEGAPFATDTSAEPPLDGWSPLPMPKVVTLTDIQVDLLRSILREHDGGYDWVVPGCDRFYSDYYRPHARELYFMLMEGD